MITPKSVPCTFKKHGSQPCGAKPGEPCTEWYTGPRGNGHNPMSVVYYHAERIDAAFEKLFKRLRQLELERQ